MGATRRPRILILAPRHPVPPRRGDQVRVYHLARALGRSAEVRVLCFGEGPNHFDGCSIRSLRPAVARRVAANLRHPSPSLPLQVRVFLDAGMARAVREELQSFRPDVLHVTLSRMGPYLAEGDWHRHVDLVDSMELNMRTRADTGRALQAPIFRLEARLAGRYEAELVERVDSASVVGEADRLAPGLGRAAVIPNGVSSDAFPYREPEDRPAVVLFFGNLGYFHNVGPARYVAERVLPRIRREVPSAVLRLAGARPAPGVRSLVREPGVELIESPEEMAPVLHSAAVAALPMLSGSGMKNKVLEAFCAGLPVVTNRLGIEGIEAQPGTHYVLADTEGDMADAVAALMKDPVERVRLATAARDLVTERYSWERSAADLLSLYGLARRQIP